MQDLISAIWLETVATLHPSVREELTGFITFALIWMANLNEWPEW